MYKKKVLLLLLVTFILSSVAAQTKTEKIDGFIAAYTKQNSFNGTALVAANGTILLNKGYGFKNVALGEMNTGNTIYQIGSVTKQFTAAVILKLAAQNKLKLTDKLSKFYPGFPKGDSITIHQLLSHTSGIFNYTDDAGFMQSEAVKPANEKKMLALFKNKPLDFSPGSNWSYSNSGYLLLGYIIEKVTKKPYEKIVREFILTPLQMNNSGFGFTHLKNKDKATGYFSIADKNSTVAGIVDSSVAFAAGALYSTTTDLYQWHKGMLQNKIISRASAEKGFTPVKRNYSYGWRIDSLDGKRITAHNGSIYGFNSSLLRIEADSVAVILLNNVRNPKLDEITTGILNIIYGKPYQLPEQKKEITVPEEILKKYIGTYEVTPQFQITVTVEEGKLMGQATNQPKFELFAEKDNYFFLKAVEAEVEFVSSDKGLVEKLILYQGGRKTEAKKIN
jgi:CubicO group peptidase (beta-lactamase class C family)